MKQTLLIILIFFSLFFQGWAQDIQFSASAKNVVRTNERFQIVYSLNQNGSDFSWPSMENFRIVSGPHTSSGSSVQIINGQVSRTIDNSFTFIVMAKEEGIFEIPAATVKIDGKTYKSNTLKIQVVKSSSNQQGGQDSGNDGNNTDYSQDVFIKVNTDKKNPYQGEQVIVTYKLYYRLNLSNPEFIKEPSFGGFWVQDLLKDPYSYNQYTEAYNGQQYHVAEIRKYALFPQKSGKLTIEPVDAMVQAEVKNQNTQRSRDPFDSFFNDPFFNRYQKIELNLTTKPQTINVKPLPSQNKPADFVGAVGDFTMDARIDKTELKTNDALTLTISLSGNGNVDLIKIPEIIFPPDFEVYDPQITKNINRTKNGISGTKSFEYIIIPRSPGKFTINPIKFSFFSHTSEKYKTLQSKAFEIKVEKGEGQYANVTYSGNNQKDIKFIGSDIRHIKTNLPDFKIAGSIFFGSKLFLILLLIPFVLFILFVTIWKKELQKRSNVALLRNRKATKVAHKRLKKAHNYQKENKESEFYIEISQALWGYLSDKFSIPLSNLSMDTVKVSLENENVKTETINTFIEVLNNCEFARFAPGDATSNMDSLYNQAVNAISLMESELK
jgi:uncharacterized membrane protein